MAQLDKTVGQLLDAGLNVLLDIHAEEDWKAGLTHGDDGASFLAVERGGQIPRAGGSLEIHHAEPRPSEDGSDAGERFRINLHARFADHHDTGGIGRLGGGEDPRSQQEGYSHARHTSLTKADPPSPGRRSTLRKMGSA